jgi:hypothetical protein
MISGQENGKNNLLKRRSFTFSRLLEWSIRRLEQIALSATAHLIDDETVSKMGHRGCSDLVRCGPPATEISRFTLRASLRPSAERVAPLGAAFTARVNARPSRHSFCGTVVGVTKNKRYKQRQRQVQQRIPYGMTTKTAKTTATARQRQRQSKRQRQRQRQRQQQ